MQVRSKNLVVLRDQGMKSPVMKVLHLFWSSFLSMVYVESRKKPNGGESKKLYIVSPVHVQF